MPINPKDRRICLLCEKEYMPIQNNQKYCKECSPSKKGNETKYAAFQRKIKLNHFREYQNQWAKTNIVRLRPKKNARLKFIRKTWGTFGQIGRFEEEKYHNIEKYGVKILEDLEYTEVRRLDCNHNMPFDIRAEKDGKIHVFQVTSGVQHATKNQKHIADELGLPFYMLFIRPDKSKYIIKQGSGMNMVTIEDLRKIGLL